MHYFDIDISHSAHNHQNDPWDIAERKMNVMILTAVTGYIRYEN